MELEKESLEMVMDSRRLMVELDAVDTTRVAFAGPEKAEVRAAAASAVEQFYSSVHRLEDQGEKDALVEEEFPFRKAEQFLFMARKQLDGLATAIGMATRANQLAFNRARAAGGREGELVDRLDDTLMARENRIAADRCGVLLQEKKRQLGEVKEILKRGRDRIQQAKRFSKRYVQDLDDLGNFWKVSVAPSANQWDRTIVVDCGLGDKDNVNKGGKAEGRVFLCPNDGFRVKEQDKGFVKLNLFQMYEWFGEPLDPTAQDPVGSVPVSNALHSFQSALLFKRVFSRIASDQVPLPEVVKVFNNSIVLENPGSEPIEILFEKFPKSGIVLRGADLCRSKAFEIAIVERVLFEDSSITLSNSILVDLKEIIQHYHLRCKVLELLHGYMDEDLIQVVVQSSNIPSHFRCSVSLKVKNRAAYPDPLFSFEIIISAGDTQIIQINSNRPHGFPFHCRGVHALASAIEGILRMWKDSQEKSVK